MKYKIAVFVVAFAILLVSYKVLTPDINVQCRTYVGTSQLDWLRMCASKSIGKNLKFLWPHSLGSPSETCVRYVAWTILPGIRVSSETPCEK